MPSPWSDFVAWFMSQPESLRALMVAGLTLALTGIGAVVALAIQHWLTSRTEKREERRRQRERLEELRRSVYLPAATAVGAMFGNLARSLDVKIDNNSINQVSFDFGTAVTRMFVVASENAIRKVAALQRALMGEYTTSLATRQVLLARQTRLTNLLTRGRELEQKIAQLVEMMKAHNIEGSRDSNRFDALERAARETAAEADKVHAEFDEQNELQLSEGISAVRDLVSRMNPLVELQADALIAIRSEMGITSDTDALREELRLNGAAARQQVDGLIKRLTQTVRQ